MAEKVKIGEFEFTNNKVGKEIIISDDYFALTVAIERLTQAIRGLRK